MEDSRKGESAVRGKGPQDRERALVSLDRARVSQQVRPPAPPRPGSATSPGAIQEEREPVSQQLCPRRAPPEHRAHAHQPEEKNSACLCNGKREDKSQTDATHGRPSEGYAGARRRLPSLATCPAVTACPREMGCSPRRGRIRPFPAGVWTWDTPHREKGASHGELCGSEEGCRTAGGARVSPGPTSGPSGPA